MTQQQCKHSPPDARFYEVAMTLYLSTILAVMVGTILFDEYLRNGGQGL